VAVPRTAQSATPDLTSIVVADVGGGVVGVRTASRGNWRLDSASGVSTERPASRKIIGYM
jgi:hypothetical protein